MAGCSRVPFRLRLENLLPDLHPPQARSSVSEWPQTGGGGVSGEQRWWGRAREGEWARVRKGPMARHLSLLPTPPFPPSDPSTTATPFHVAGHASRYVRLYPVPRCGVRAPECARFRGCNKQGFSFLCDQLLSSGLAGRKTWQRTRTPSVIRRRRRHWCGALAFHRRSFHC